MKKIILLAIFSLHGLALNLTPKLTVSGISSGGYFANQFHVAHSDIVEGSAIFAAGPYNCAKDNAAVAMTMCMKAIAVRGQGYLSYSFISYMSALGVLPNTSNFANDRVFIFSGKNDDVVKPKVSDELVELYQYLGVNELKYVNTLPAGHTYPTMNKGEACKNSKSPYIGNCQYDGAFNSLRWLYPDRRVYKLSLKGKLAKISQLKYKRDFYFLEPMMQDDAYLYIPRRCQLGLKCSLHIAFHGCNQTLDDIGMSYITQTGITEAADKLNLVVLFPQARKSPKSELFRRNPNGCWDWWGYSGLDYKFASGPQQEIVFKMASEILK